MSFFSSKNQSIYLTSAAILFLILSFQNCGESFKATSSKSTLMLDADEGTQGPNDLPPPTEPIANLPQLKKITITGPTVTVRGSCSKAFVVSLIADNDQPISVMQDTPLTVLSLRNGTVFSDSACTQMINTLSVLPGQSTSTYYVKNSMVDYQEIKVILGTIESDAFKHTVFKRNFLGGGGIYVPVTVLSDNKLFDISFLLVSTLDPATPSRMRVDGSLIGLELSAESNPSRFLASGTVFQSPNLPITGFTEGVEIYSNRYSSPTWCALVKGKVHCVIDNVVTPIPGMDSGITDLQTYDNRSCVIKSGQVFCWSNSINANPVSITGLESGVTDLSVGSSRSCAVKEGNVYCWQGRVSSQLTQFSNVLNIETQRSGVADDPTCAILNNRTVECLNSSGVKLALPSLNNVDEITPGHYGSGLWCAKQDTQVYCWSVTDYLPQLMTNVPPVR